MRIPPIHTLPSRRVLRAVSLTPLILGVLLVGLSGQALEREVGNPKRTSKLRENPASRDHRFKDFRND